MASEHNLTNHRPWWHISKRIARNPFDPQYPIEHLEYCKTCNMDVDVKVEVGNAGGVDVYKKLCKRCGQVMQYGIGQRNIDGDSKQPIETLLEARRFIQKTGRDRR